MLEAVSPKVYCRLDNLSYTRDLVRETDETLLTYNEGSAFLDFVDSLYSCQRCGSHHTKVVMLSDYQT